MKNEGQKISIIMNCFNGEKYLEEALNSVFSQSYEDWEIIFYDNCSTDRSAEIALNYQPKLKYYKSKKNISLGEARNIAMQFVTGKWIAVLDVDDYWHQDFLRTSIDALEKTDCVMSYAGICEIDKDGNRLREMIPVHDTGYQFEEQLCFFEINMQTPLISRDFLNENNLTFNASMVTSEDFNLFVRLAAKGEILVLKEVLAFYRVHESMTNKYIKNWHLDHELTFKQLLHENPDLREKYPRAFNNAESKAKYYKARYLISEKEFKEGINVMSSIRYNSKLYYFLWIISFSPLLWRLVHLDFIKRGLSKSVGVFMFKELTKRS